MENSPYYPSERADSQSSDSKDKKSESFGYAAQFRPAERVSFEPPARAERPPIAPPIEGIISWRDRQDELNSPASEKGEDNKSEKDDSDEEGDDSKGTKPAKPQPIQRPAPLRQEAQPVTAEEDTTEGDEENASDAPVADVPLFAYPGEGVAPVSRLETTTESNEDTDEPQRPRPTAPAFGGSRLDDFPPLAPREAFVPQATAVGEFVPSSHTEAAEDRDDQQPVAPPVPVAAPVSAPRMNIWNQAPNTAPQQFEDDPDDDFGPTPATAPLAGGAGGQPPVPPVNNQVAAYNQQPMGPGYGAGYNQYTHPATQYGEQYNAAPAAPVMPIERPQYNANYDPRVGQVGAVLGLGLLAEHIGRKRADRKLEKRVNERTDTKLEHQNEAFVADQRRLQEKQRQFANEQQQQIDEMQRMRRNQEQFAAAPQQAEQYTAAPTPVQFESAPNAGPSYAPQRVENRPLPLSPNERPQMRPEAQHVAPVVNVEQAGDQTSVEQNYNLQPNQHVEHSAWHNIVVDDRGHEVAGAINYGEGFRRERQQEMIRDRVADGAAAGAAGQSQYQQQGQFGGPSYPGALPSGMTTPGLPQGQPTHADTQHQLQASNSQPVTNFTNPWFWIMILLVIAAFFTAALI